MYERKHANLFPEAVVKLMVPSQAAADSQKKFDLFSDMHFIY
jgi:hypothetical protein